MKKARNKYPLKEVTIFSNIYSTRKSWCMNWSVLQSFVKFHYTVIKVVASDYRYLCPLGSYKKLRHFLVPVAITSRPHTCLHHTHPFPLSQSRLVCDAPCKVMTVQAVCTSETSVTLHQTTLRNIPQDSYLQFMILIWSIIKFEGESLI
jgi:hypothetical protein